MPEPGRRVGLKRGSGATYRLVDPAFVALATIQPTDHPPETAKTKVRNLTDTTKQKIMKHLFYELMFIMIPILTSTSISAQSITSLRPPIWELGRDTINSAAICGNIQITDGKVVVDAQNYFSLPNELLGDQDNYTIEFEVQRPDRTRDWHSLTLVSNMSANGNSGLALRYHPPSYNCGWLLTNGHLTVEYRDLFIHDDTIKITISVKDRKIMLFRDGLLLAMTDDVLPSNLPLTFGGSAGKSDPLKGYQMSRIRIYDHAIYPTGFDPSAEHMRNYSGDQYNMQRVEIKNTSLPRILVVGDSFSMGYRRYITEYFKDKVYVDYWVGGRWLNPNDVEDENSEIKRSWRGVLSNGPYDVVSWNASTLHMWNAALPGRCPIESYPANMNMVVSYLQKIAPKTHFIWVRCTPITHQIDSETRSIDTQRSQRLDMFNKLTDTIMKQHNIPEVDLYGLCETMPELGNRDGVHWLPDGYKKMAALIIDEIEQRLFLVH